MRALIVTLVAGFLMPAGSQAQEQEPPEPTGTNHAAAVFDVLVVRPLALIVVPIGVAGFIPIALMTAPNGMESVQTALELFVTGPANYVFQRPLGEF